MSELGTGPRPVILFGDDERANRALIRAYLGADFDRERRRGVALGLFRVKPAAPVHGGPPP